jgi:hypothetical protein
MQDANLKRLPVEGVAAMSHECLVDVYQNRAMRAVGIGVIASIVGCLLFKEEIIGKDHAVCLMVFYVSLFGFGGLHALNKGLLHYWLKDFDFMDAFAFLLLVAAFGLVAISPSFLSSISKEILVSIALAKIYCSFCFEPYIDLRVSDLIDTQRMKRLAEYEENTRNRDAERRMSGPRDLF